MNSIGLVEVIFRDLRHAWRWLRLNRAFSIVAVLSLALGIGANTAIFELIDAIRIRTLPIPNPQDLAEVRLAPPRGRSGNFTSRRPELTYPLWEGIQRRQQSFSGLFAWSATMFDLASGGEQRNAQGLWVSGDFFDVLHISPERGRLLTLADDTRGCSAPGVVLSHGFWQREFGGIDSAIGRTLTLDGKPFEIIGITDPSFFGMEVGRSFDVALPLCSRHLWPGADAFMNRRAWWLAAAGRLRGGLTLERAAADLRGISPALFEDTVEPTYTAGEAKNYKNLKLTALPAATGVSDLRNQYETPLWILLGTTAVVLLIACANIANLMLARATARQREISIRLAIGASRSRLVRQLLVESLLLATIGATLGLVLSRSLSRFLVLFLGSQRDQLTLQIQTDWRVLFYTSGIALLTCLIFGLLPAIRGTRVGPGAVLKSSGRGLTADRHRFGIRRTLVIAQVALSLTLLVGALLFAGSLRNLTTLDSGFRPQGVLFVHADLQRLKLEPARRPAMWSLFEEGLKSAPHVEVEAAVSHAPLVNGWNDNVRAKTQANNGAYVLSNFDQVGEGYFKAVGTGLVSGRTFDRRDTISSPKVAVVDETFADKVLHSKNPIGEQFEIEADPGHFSDSFEVVGIVRNVKYSGLRTDFIPTAYIADTQRLVNAPPITLGENKTFVIRSGAPLNVLTSELNESIRKVNPGIGIQFQVFDTIIRDSLVSERLMATLSSFFGLLAAALATVGLYGTLSYTVTQRRNEIGIRIALGAGGHQVVHMILAEAAVLLVAGLAAGAITTYFASRAVASLLYGIQPNNPFTTAIAGTALGVVTLCASYLPARRAARLEAATVLREE